MQITLMHFMLCEDLSTDIMNIQNQINQLTIQKNQRVKQLDTQLARLQKMLQQKQQQLMQQTKRNPPQQQQAQQTNQQGDQQAGAAQ